MNRREFLEDALIAVAGVSAAAAADTAAVIEGGSAMQQIAVFAELLFPQAASAQAAAALARLGEETRKETGCRRYVVAQDLADPGRFHLSELWDNLNSLAAHFDTPHVASFSAVALALGYSAPFIKRIEIASIEDLRPSELKSILTSPANKPTWE
jgi:quinol monooxygenase YgiN